jgi:hypothetical protein
MEGGREGGREGEGEKGGGRRGKEGRSERAREGKGAREDAWPSERGDKGSERESATCGAQYVRARLQKRMSGSCTARPMQTTMGRASAQNPPPGAA